MSSTGLKGSIVEVQQECILPWSPGTRLAEPYTRFYFEQGAAPDPDGGFTAGPGWIQLGLVGELRAESGWLHSVQTMRKKPYSYYIAKMKRISTLQ